MLRGGMIENILVFNISLLISNFFPISSCLVSGMHFFCGFEVSLSTRLNHVRTKRAFYADQAQTKKKIRMQHQNASSENWKERAVQDMLPAQMNQWRRQKEKLSDGNCLCPGLGALCSLRSMKGRIVSRFLWARKVPPAVVSGPSICQDCRANKRNQGWLCQIPSWRRGGMEWKKG